MKQRKGIVRMLLLLAFVMFMTPGMQTEVLANECLSWDGNNENAQNYSRWSSPITSYLSQTNDNQLMRVQAASKYEGILVEYYDANYNLLSNRVIPQELPIFGGFYASENYYFVITGQNNSSESSNVECFRITKYDKSWNRIASAGLYDCNTTVPFDAGSLRVAEYGDWLLIRTSHEMYTSSDGVNHQANVTIQLNMNTMKITDSYTKVMNSDYGYVSHSFNQFIMVENGKIVSVDHGDAHPRSIALIKYQTDVTTGKFVPGYYEKCDVVDVIQFPGASGENTTGASVGGFEASGSSYLIAGNSVVQDSQNLSRKTRNVFVSAVSKSDNTVTTTWLTNYAEGETTTTTPQLIKISDNEFLVLWSREEQVFYTKVNGTGQQEGQIYTMNGTLSDCQPIVWNGKLVWYTWNNEIIQFHEILLSDLSSASSKEVMTGHRYVHTATEDGQAKLSCEICGKETTVYIADSLNVYWNTTGYYNTYSSRINLVRNVGDQLYYLCNMFSLQSNNYVDEIIIENSNPDVVQVHQETNKMGMLTFKKPGTATVSFYPKYNMDLKKTYVFQVNENGFVAVTSIALENYVFSLKTGETKQLNPTVYPENASNKELTYVSSNPSVVEVSSNGSITAKSVGNAKITIKANDGSTVETNAVVFVSESEGDSENGGNNNTGNGSNGTTGNGGNNNTGNGGIGDIINGIGTIIGGNTNIKWNGLSQADDGNWYYYVNGQVDTSFTGLYCDTTYGWWLVQNGTVAFDYNGLYCDATCGWWLINGGTVAFDYTGLYCDATCGWWLIGGGTVAFDYTGLWNDSNYGWWLIGGGTVCFDYNGLWNDNHYGWWLVNGGTVAFDYTGLWNDSNYGWWLIGGGTVCFDYTGLWCDSNYGWWLIGGGTVAFDYTGLWNDSNYGWWLIGGGTVAFDYTGLWYDETYGWWYVENGTVGFWYTGETYYDGMPYYVVNGQLV